MLPPLEEFALTNGFRFRVSVDERRPVFTMQRCRRVKFLSTPILTFADRNVFGQAGSFCPAR